METLEEVKKLGQDKNDMTFTCMYTKHVTQKKKTWQDGVLRLKGQSLTIYELEDDKMKPQSLDSKRSMSLKQVFDGGIIKMNRYLLDISECTPFESSISRSTTTGSVATTQRSNPVGTQSEKRTLSKVATENTEPKRFKTPFQRRPKSTAFSVPKQVVPMPAPVATVLPTEQQQQPLRDVTYLHAEFKALNETVEKRSVDQIRLLFQSKTQGINQ